MQHWKTVQRRLITDGVLTTSGAANRANLDTQGWQSVTFKVAATRVAYTRLDIIIETSMGDGNLRAPTFANFRWERLETKSISSGTAALSDEENQKTVSASANFDLNYDINWPYMRISVDAEGPTTDTVTVDAILGGLR
jgi:hypothetical protein